MYVSGEVATGIIAKMVERTERTVQEGLTDWRDARMRSVLTGQAGNRDAAKPVRAQKQEFKTILARPPSRSGLVGGRQRPASGAHSPPRKECDAMPRRSEPIRTASPYAYANAQEAVRRFLGRHRRIVIGAVLVLIVCAVPTVVRAPDIEGLAVYAVVCLGVSFASVVLSRRNVDGLLGILSADCCARKMLDATALLMGKRTRRRERPTWEVLYAMCSAQLGYDDIALQWADEAESSPGLSLSNRLLACNVRAVVAEHRDDRDALANVRGRVAALAVLCSNGRASVRLRRTAHLLLAWIDFDLALEDKDWQHCNELLGAMDALSSTRQQQVGAERRRGLLAEARGDLSAARDRYAFVADNGGDCCMARISSEWLDAHEGVQEATARTAGAGSCAASGPGEAMGAGPERA